MPVPAGDDPVTANEHDPAPEASDGRAPTDAVDVVAPAPTPLPSGRSKEAADDQRDTTVLGDPRGRSDATLIVDVDPRSLVAVVVAVIVGTTVLALFRSAPDALTVTAVGIILALALDPVVRRLQVALHWPRARAVGLVGFLLLAIATIVVLLLGPPAVDQASRFGRELPDTVKQFYDLPFIGRSLERANASERVSTWLSELPAQVSDKSIADAIQRLVGGAFSAIEVVVVTFAVLLDGEAIVARIRRLVPERLRPRADWVGRVFHRTIGNYFGGSLTLAVLQGVFVLAVGLALGVPLVPLAALWAMLTNLIPQIGGFLGGSFFVILALSQGVVVGVVAAVLFIAYLNLDNHILQPAIIGEAVNLTPPTTMLAALIGGAAAGVPGALVATPLVGTVKRLYLELRYGDEKRAEPVAPATRLRGWFRRRIGRRSTTAPPDG